MPSLRTGASASCLLPRQLCASRGSGWRGEVGSLISMSTVYRFYYTVRHITLRPAHVNMGKNKGGDKNAGGAGGKGAKGGKGGGNDKDDKKGPAKKNGLKIKIRHILWYVFTPITLASIVRRTIVTNSAARSNHGWRRPCGRSRRTARTLTRWPGSSPRTRRNKVRLFFLSFTL